MLDLVVTLGFVAIIGLIGFLTYRFGFKPIEEETATRPDTQTPVKSSRSVKEAKSESNSTRKKAKTEPSTPVVSTPTETKASVSKVEPKKEKAVVKPESSKKQEASKTAAKVDKQPEKTAKKTKKGAKTEQNDELLVEGFELSAADAAGWITVGEKKPKKTPGSPKSSEKSSKKDSSESGATSNTPTTNTDNEELTVVSPKKGKKKEKQPQGSQQQPAAVAAAKPQAQAQASKPAAAKSEPVEAKNSATPLIIVQNQTKSSPAPPPTVPVITIQGKFDINAITSSIIDSVISGQTKNLVIGSKAEPITTEQALASGQQEGDEWLPASSKPKKNPKTKKPESDLGAASSEKPVQPSPTTKDGKKKPKSKTENEAQVEKSIQAEIRAEVTADINNNQPKTTKTTPAKTKPIAADLKQQTSMSSSIVVIEKEALVGDKGTKKAGGASAQRTESNQSSSESLQDVEGEEGFITITSKKTNKKPAVRRET